MFISLRLCGTHIIYKYSYIVLSLCLTMTENINRLGSKLERAPSCIKKHSGPLQPRTTEPTDARPLYALYINIITTLIQHILSHHHYVFIYIQLIYTYKMYDFRDNTRDKRATRTLLLKVAKKTLGKCRNL